MTPATVVTETAAALQAAHPEVPAEKLAHMVARTFIGLLFVLVGLALLGLLVALPAIAAFHAGTMEGVHTVPLVVGFAGGLGMVVLGATVWSSQLVARPIALTTAAFKGVWTAVRSGAA